jgi:hypothetical protein
MSMLKKFIFVASMLLVALPTFASEAGGLFVEPFVSYEKGDSDIDYPAPFSNSSGDINGFGVGARLGAHFAEVVFVGLDGRYIRPHFKDSTNGISADASGYNYGAVLGVQTPVVGLRVWGTYVFGGQLDPESDNSVDLKFKDAKGYRVGVGFRIAIVSLNLEYQDLKYDTTVLQALGPFTSGAESSIDLKDKAWILSVSFPIEI